jgi:hypothetical protein
MWQSFAIALILILCLFFIGRRLLQQFNNTIDPKKGKPGCACGCSGCSSQGNSPQDCGPVHPPEKEGADR